ncbi:hypothetical protein [Streptomyces zagrosensis]|uniref:hypothetical protein n=1 Tax=Streptomyces zagrosensis TaxID=1042984 RepID=UPI00406BC773
MRGWSDSSTALAATLADAEAPGHDPTTLLTESAAHRELGTAEPSSEVLVWRLRRADDLPADATNLPVIGGPATSRPTSRPVGRSASPQDLHHRHR